MADAPTIFGVPMLPASDDILFVRAWDVVMISNGHVPFPGKLQLKAR